MLLLNRISRFVMMWSVLILIKAYQRWISPFKGYSCAYRVHTGEKSCSGYGYDVVRRFGALIGLKLIQRRMIKCADVFHLHCSNLKTQSPVNTNFQSGHCDVSFDGCDLSIGGCDVCDLGQVVGDICTPDFSSGCGSSQRKKTEKLKYKPLPKSL